MQKNMMWKAIALFFLSVFLANNALAAEPGTFGYFYSESLTINWWFAIGFAVLAAILVITTGGAASPAVASGVAPIATMIGNVAGYSGVAATNYGLALLGGGALAAGGTGMAGGAALLSAALIFGGSAVTDLAFSAGSTKYSYQSLVEQSKNIPTLPPPIRTTGSEPYKKAQAILKGYKKEEPINGNQNQAVFREAIGVAEKGLNGVKNDEEVQLRTLLSYLYFATNQYKESAIQSRAAIKLARELNLKWTLPAYVYAVSSLYAEKPDFSSLNDEYFRYSVVAEPGNALVPILFSQYMSHINLRFRGDTSSYYLKVGEVARDGRLREYSDQILTSMLVNYFVNLKMEQQRITVLSNSTNEKIKNSPATLDDTERALKEYKALLKGAKGVLTLYRVIPEPTAAEKLLIDARVNLDRTQARLDQLLKSNLSKEEVRHAQAEAEKMLVESKASLNKAKSAIDQLVSDHVDQSTLQRMRDETGRLVNASKEGLEEVGASIRIYVSGKMDKDEVNRAQAMATEVLNDSRKSIDEAAIKLQRYLNREKEKRELIVKLDDLLKAYESDAGRLQGLVQSLKVYQAQNAQQPSAKKEDVSPIKKFLQIFK